MEKKISLISYIGSVGKAMGDKSDDKKNKNVVFYPFHSVKERTPKAERL